MSRWPFDCTRMPAAGLSETVVLRQQRQLEAWLSQKRQQVANTVAIFAVLHFFEFVAGDFAA